MTSDAVVPLTTQQAEQVADLPDTLKVRGAVPVTVEAVEPTAPPSISGYPLPPEPVNAVPSPTVPPRAPREVG